MAVWYRGSTQWAASTAYSVGDLRRQMGYLNRFGLTLQRFLFLLINKQG